MKRLILTVLIVIVVATPLTADQAPAITYDLAAATFAEMLELLDQAVYLVTGAGAAGTVPDIKKYAQGIVNLLVGPHDVAYIPENAVSTETGVLPLFEQLHTPYSDGVPFDELFPETSMLDRRAADFLRSWEIAEYVLPMAVMAAQDVAWAHIPSVQELYTLYSLLVSVRGGDDEVFPLGGIATLVDIFPAREIWVEHGESIQSAIDRTPEDGTVYLAPGVYRESIVIDKSLRLASASSGQGNEGMGAVVFADTLYGCAITIGADVPIGVSIEGMEISGNQCGIGIGGEGAVVALSDVRFVDNEIGLLMVDGSSGLVEACIFNGNHLSIRVSSNSSATVRNCLIEESTGWEGAIDLSCSSLTVEGCDILDNNGPGLKVGPAGTSLHLVDCVIARNGKGILASPGDCSDGIVRYGSFAEITGWGNTIPDSGEPDQNEFGAFDATAHRAQLDLAFLTQPKPDEE